MGELVLVIGGARSGKSRFAQKLASANGGRVIYLATLDPGDAEMRQRVEMHRDSRPGEWETLEEPLAVVAALSKTLPYDVCLFDCLTLWVSNLLLAAGEAIAGTDAKASARVLERVRELVDWQAAQAPALIVVSNEVGSGLVPEYPLGRLYRDVLGEANQILAVAAKRAYLCVAGYALDIKATGIQIR